MERVGVGEGVTVTRIGVTVTGTTVGGIVTVGSSVGNSKSCEFGVNGTRTVGEFGFVGGGGTGFALHAASARQPAIKIKTRFTFIRSTRLPLSRHLLLRCSLPPRLLQRRLWAQRSCSRFPPFAAASDTACLQNQSSPASDTRASRS